MMAANYDVMGWLVIVAVVVLAIVGWR